MAGTQSQVILVEVDATPAAASAVAWATVRAARRRSTILLATTVCEGDSYDDAVQELGTAEALLREYSGDLDRHGIAHDSVVVNLSQSSFAEMAVAKRASLIVLPEHNKRRVRWLRATLRARVLARQAARAVVTVPTNWPDAHERWHTI